MFGLYPYLKKSIQVLNLDSAKKVSSFSLKINIETKISCIGVGGAGVRDAALPHQLPQEQSRFAQHAGHGHPVHIPLPRMDQGPQADQLRQVENCHHLLQGVLFFLFLPIVPAKSFNLRQKCNFVSEETYLQITFNYFLNYALF